MTDIQNEEYQKKYKECVLLLGNLNDNQLNHILGILKSLSEVERLKDACKTVVDGYEGDGMENMRIRDNVFYEYCKMTIRLFEPQYTIFNN